MCMVICVGTCIVICMGTCVDMCTRVWGMESNYYDARTPGMCATPFCPFQLYPWISDAH